MSSYNYPTSTFPGAPRPTPASNRPARAPIYNPYDKFPQNEFDSWIGGITGALRRALGQDDEEEQSIVAHSDAVLDHTHSENSAYPDSEVEDSFAELKARRDKGKGRDPREGPGLGGEHQPIEILGSDSEEEDAEGSFEEEEDIEEEGGPYHEDDKSSEEVDEDTYGPGWDEEEEGSGGFEPEASGHHIQVGAIEEDIADSFAEEDEESPGLDDELASDVEERYSPEGELDSPERYPPAIEAVTSFYPNEQAGPNFSRHGPDVTLQEEGDGFGGDGGEYYEGEEGDYEDEEEGWDEEDGGDVKLREEYSDDEQDDDMEDNRVGRIAMEISSHRHPSPEVFELSDSEQESEEEHPQPYFVGIQPTPTHGRSEIAEPAIEDAGPAFDHIEPTFDHTEPTFDHTEPTFDHTEPTFDHTEPTFHHTEPTFHHTEPTFDHTEPTFHHTEPTFDHTEPTFHHTEPTFHHIEPPIEQAEPTSEDVGPAIEHVDLATEDVEPTIEDVGPAIEIVGPAIEEGLEHSIEEFGPATEDVKPATEDVEHAIEEFEPLIEDVEPAIETIEPTIQYIEPTVRHVEPAVQHVEPAVQHVEPAVQHVEPAIQHIEPVIQHVEPTIQHIEPGIQDIATSADANNASLDSEMEPVVAYDDILDDNAIKDSATGEAEVIRAQITEVSIPSQASPHLAKVTDLPRLDISLEHKTDFSTNLIDSQELLSDEDEGSPQLLYPPSAFAEVGEALPSLDDHSYMGAFAMENTDNQQTEMMPSEKVLHNPPAERPVDDSSEPFPPAEQMFEQPELSDPWEGVHTFAEDFYTGGDIREGLRDPATVTPSRLTPVHEYFEAQELNGNEDHPSEASSRAQTEEPSFLDVDMLEDEDEKDADFIPDASPRSLGNDAQFVHPDSGAVHQESLEGPDRFSTSQSQSWEDRQALSVENGLLTTSHGNSDSQNDCDQPPGLSDDRGSSGPEGSVTPKSVRSVIGDPKGLNNVLYEDVDAEGEPNLDSDQSHAKTQQVDFAQEGRQDGSPDAGGALGFSSAAVSVVQQEARVIVSSKAHSSPPKTGIALPDPSHNSTLSPPVAIEPRLRPTTISETTADSLTDIAFGDANSVHMSDGQSLPSDQDQGLSSQNVDPDDAATRDDDLDASTLENTDSTTAIPGLVDNDLNSVDKLALESAEIVECAISLEDFTVPPSPPGLDSQPAENIVILGSTDLKEDLTASSPSPRLMKTSIPATSLNHKGADDMLVNVADDKALTTPQSSSPLSSPVYAPEYSHLTPVAVHSSFGPPAPSLAEPHTTRASAAPAMLLSKPLIPIAITSNPSSPSKASPSHDIHSSATPTMRRSKALIPIAITAGPSSLSEGSHGMATETTPPAKPPRASNASAPDPSGSRIPAELEDDPFKLMGNDSAAAPSSTPNEEEILEHQQVWWAGRARIDHKPTAQEDSRRLLKTRTPAQRSSNAQADTSLRKARILRSGTSLDSKNATSASAAPKGSKRKRGNPSSIPTRLTRSLSTKALKGKGKGKEENDAVSENGSASSGASAASKILGIPSRESSRASSILSTPSIESSSISVQPSPTLTRQTGSTNAQSKIPLMFHAHSVGHHHHHHHHHHHGPPGAARSLAQNQTRSLPTLSSGTLSQAKSRPAPAANSPVTRSNCRFHRISLPRAENGPRVSFIVPGCSLRDSELMMEEEIKDHGDATHSDHERMIGDIESLDFSVELIATLRLLCGVDLIRENEVFYLPEPGESHRRKRHGKSKSIATRSSLGNVSVSAAHESAVSPRFSKAHKPTQTSSLTQNTESDVATTSTSLRQNLEQNPFSDSELSDLEDSTSNPKRIRKDSLADGANGTALPPRKPISAGTIVIPSPTRRKADAGNSKKLSIDNYAIRPEEEESSDDELTKDTSHLVGMRGMKRTRTSEAHSSPAGPSEQPIAKRLRNDGQQSSTAGHT